ncbi:unnamed protein product [Polarella glacialis]|uniref:Uncharacterized protein n=1 Tax=Polarella glacialis TaxID=89957 RepID=A0A813HQT7_POLGL|nr:unnamed protein product [Polarella glacialis]CAE8640681.1 unnamed protein product [Polarella glacialis]|mmetsp:Transcript_8751/g.16289  ORF Transcript_8751/g.16289 Transcript_8751/m.16289 type:complete len:191 (+) Transcript_8751:159-731(+)
MSWGTKIIPRDLSANDVMNLNARILKEDKAIVEEYERHLGREGAKKHSRSRHSRSGSRGDRDRHRHSRSHHASRAQEATLATGLPQPVTAEGEPLRLSTAPSLLSRRSASSSALSRSSRSSSCTQMPPLPSDLSALGRFPFVADSMMKMRLEQTGAGLMPKMRFRAVHNTAHWVPGSKSYLDYQPEFYFE